MRHLLARWVVALAAVLSAVIAAPASAVSGAQLGSAADDAEQALAEKFAPVVRLVHQDAECGPGEPYQPTDVELVMGDPSVALRGAWAEDDMIQAGPTAEDLGEGLFGYHLDYPGNPLQAGCDYEKWVRAAVAGTPPTTYAHVATEAGRDDRLAVQYWFFYPFNDYTNKHEGDWEMVQLVFAAGDAAQALGQTRSRSATRSTRGRTCLRRRVQVRRSAGGALSTAEGVDDAVPGAFPRRTSV
jgi:hypothetical protein